MKQHEIQIRVRYSETDAMGLLHHSNYLSYFEVGRTELYRQQGGCYRTMEENGLFLVVAKAEIKYLRPARFDDLLTLRTTVAKVGPAKLVHDYELFRDGECLTQALVTLGCVNKEGKLQRMPDFIIELMGD
jgi:acyl-CoA thioester hydrolase